MQDNLAIAGIRFLTTVSRSVHYALFQVGALGKRWQAPTQTGCLIMIILMVPLTMARVDDSAICLGH